MLTCDNFGNNFLDDLSLQQKLDEAAYQNE